MRTETTTRTLYKFDELSDAAQTKAVDRLYDLNVNHDWWDCTYEDAQRVGLKITGFDTGRGNSVDIEFVRSPTTVAELIIKEHGKDCDTHKLAVEFLKTAAIDGEDDDRDDEFLRALGEEYLSMLRGEYEYLTSREAIVESIIANDYEFTEDGRLA